MRCTNCGWDNTAGSARCIKCNTSIDADTGKKNNVIPAGQKKDNPYGGTVADANYGVSAENTGNQPGAIGGPGDDKMIKCGGCGFPNLSGAVICSNCRQPIVDVAAGEADEKGAPGKGTVRPDQLSRLPELKGTIDPYVSKFTEDSACYLQLVNKEDQYGVTDEIINETLEFSSGDSPIELNRGNIDPGNMTITSRVQAELVNKNGKWFLKDCSDLQTTFIRAGNATELNEGDIILMGDRKFIFSTPQN